jgi:hypothetical protein
MRWAAADIGLANGFISAARSSHERPVIKRIFVTKAAPTAGQQCFDTHLRSQATFGHAKTNARNDAALGVMPLNHEDNSR